MIRKAEKKDLADVAGIQYIFESKKERWSI